ncbi:MAG TPA: dihydrofolate reductase family protein [Steroidobacteraceae bacterium]|nr:dihydrofolate reductase family protein [Steroidobacteraceae bacterium]
MRKLIASVMMSLDGVMQSPGGPEEDPTHGFRFGGWTWAFSDDVFGQELMKLFSAPFDLLLGRKTYEIFSAYWAHHDENPIGKRFNSVTKYVATTSNMSLAWRNSVAIHDAARDVANLKQQDGPALLTQGSSNLLQSLLKADLIDEFRVSIFPLILGSGKRMFAEGALPAGLKLIDTKVSSTGVLINTYARAGDIKTDASPLQNPSPEELQRRKRWSKEG